jgi:hypothetical protein
MHRARPLCGKLDGSAGTAFLPRMAQDADVSIRFRQGRFDRGGKGGTRGFRDGGAAAREGDGKHIIFQLFGAHAGKAAWLGQGWQGYQSDAQCKQ